MYNKCKHEKRLTEKSRQGPKNVDSGKRKDRKSGSMSQEDSSSVSES